MKTFGGIEEYFWHVVKKKHVLKFNILAVSIWIAFSFAEGYPPWRGACLQAHVHFERRQGRGGRQPQQHRRHHLHRGHVRHARLRRKQARRHSAHKDVRGEILQRISHEFLFPPVISLIVFFFFFCQVNFVNEGRIN